MIYAARALHDKIPAIDEPVVITFFSDISYGFIFSIGLLHHLFTVDAKLVGQLAHLCFRLIFAALLLCHRTDDC